MPKYLVTVPEVHLSKMLIDAGSKSEALAKVADGQGIESSCEFSHTLEDNSMEWVVEKVNYPY